MRTIRGDEGRALREKSLVFVIIITIAG